MSGTTDKDHQFHIYVQQDILIEQPVAEPQKRKGKKTIRNSPSSKKDLIKIKKKIINDNYLYISVFHYFKIRYKTPKIDTQTPFSDSCTPTCLKINR